MLGRRLFQPQLREDRAHVLLHGADADEQPSGDARVAPAFGHQIEHVALAGREGGERVRAAMRPRDRRASSPARPSCAARARSRRAGRGRRGPGRRLRARLESAGGRRNRLGRCGQRGRGIQVWSGCQAGRASRVRKVAAARAAHGSSGETGASEPKRRFAPAPAREPRGYGSAVCSAQIESVRSRSSSACSGCTLAATPEPGEARDVGVRDELGVLDRAGLRRRPRRRPARRSSRHPRSRG